MHDSHSNQITPERIAALENRLRRCERIDVCAPLEILKLPTGDIIHYVGVPQPPHISQFSKKFEPNRNRAKRRNHPGTNQV